MQEHQLVVLVGPKGAGKSTIGHILATELGIHFLRVEPLFLTVRDEIGATHPEFEKHGFEAVFASVRNALAAHRLVCFESTGASSLFPAFLARLRAICPLVLVRVYASPQQYLHRVQNRDLSIHIPVSDDRVLEVNTAAEQVVLPWALELNNSGPLVPSAIVAAFRRILQSEEHGGV